MADWARSLQSGFQTGLQLGQTLRQRRLEDALAEEAAKYAPTEVAAGDEALRTFREGTAQTNTFTLPDGRTVTPAEYEAQYLGGLQQRPAGFTVGGQDYASLAAAEQAAAPQRASGLANVYRQFGDVGKAEEMMGLSRQSQLQNLQISEAQRQQDFNTALQDLNKQKFEKPEDRTAATLDLYRIYDPKGAAALEESYTKNEINKIALRSQQFEEGYNQARAKGVDSVIKWYDGINDGFTLRREGDQIIQTDTAGNERVFAKGTDAEIMKRINEEARPDKFLETAKAEADIARSESQTALARAQTAALPTTAAGQGIDRRIKLAGEYRDQLNDLRDELANADEESPKAQRLAKQIDDLTVKLYGVTESIRSGLQGTGKQTPVGETINVRGQVFRKTKEGADSDSSSWEPVSGGATPAGEPTSGARPSARSRTEAAPVGLERMGQGYGRLTPEALLAEGVRAGDPNAIAEQRRRQEIEAARSVITPGYNQLGVY